MENVDKVLNKCEIIYVVLIGFVFDQFVEQKFFLELFQYFVEIDELFYGIDEIIFFLIVNVYGLIGLINFGYLDKEKIGIIKEFDESLDGIYIFMDDIVVVFVVVVVSRIVYMYQDL